MVQLALAAFVDALSWLARFAVPLGVVLLGALLCGAWAASRGRRVSPAPAALAGLLGAVVATLLAARALGRSFLWTLALAAVSPLAFLWPGNAGLLLGLLGVAALLSFLPQGTWRRVNGTTSR